MSEGLKDFMVGLRDKNKHITVAASCSYQAKLVAQRHWNLPSTLDMDVFPLTPEGKPTGKILLEGE